jgi:hypothetical protein
MPKTSAQQELETSPAANTAAHESMLFYKHQEF